MQTTQNLGQITVMGIASALFHAGQGGRRSGRLCRRLRAAARTERDGRGPRGQDAGRPGLTDVRKIPCAQDAPRCCMSPMVSTDRIIAFAIMSFLLIVIPWA